MYNSLYVQVLVEGTSINAIEKQIHVYNCLYIDQTSVKQKERKKFYAPSNTLRNKRTKNAAEYIFVHETDNTVRNWRLALSE